MNYDKKQETNQVMNVTRNISICELNLQCFLIVRLYAVLRRYYILITNLFYCYHCFIDSIRFGKNQLTDIVSLNPNFLFC